MTGRLAWTAGNGVGLTWSTAINSADLASIPNGSSVLSSVADIANGTNLDIWCDLSAELVIASSTIAAGANLTFWLYALLDNATNYGDGQLASGTQAAKTPAFAPIGIMPIPAVAATTNLFGFIQGIIIPPGSFRFAMQNNSGFALTSGTQTVKYRTYNQNLNN